MAPSAISNQIPGDQNISLRGPTFQVDGHVSSDGVFDLICVGFGPASLAVGIALSERYSCPRTLFLERQLRFGWHSGMQLPAAKMQISFLKDLATPRNPRSQFTFLNYLFAKGRLNHFINLGTFYPSRAEYEDYLRWCASHFERENQVRYGAEVLAVGVGSRNAEGRVNSWTVRSRENGTIVERTAKQVVIAVGGKPALPENLKGLPQVTHSSHYAKRISAIQETRHEKKLSFAVVGSGQSAAEIFDDLWERFPDANVNLIIKGPSLRPSDDSPFVNEIFDPEHVSEVYYASPSAREASLALDRSTNYGVVRLGLLEHLYEKQYMQRLKEPDKSMWRCKILPNRHIITASPTKDGGIALKLEETVGGRYHEVQELHVDYVFAATGYARNAHEEMLAELRSLLPNKYKDEKFPVKRNYGVQFDETKVATDEAGIWLQGCNESTHGLSDTLLSILAVRGGELVESIFGGEESCTSETTSSASTPSC